MIFIAVRLTAGSNDLFLLKKRSRAARLPAETRAKETGMYTIAVVVGSLRKGSINKTYAENLVEAAKDLFDARLIPLEDIPMFNQDLEDNLPEPVIRFKKTVEAADGIIFVTPEYNRSIPPLLKNAIDWGSRPPGKNSWLNKPAGYCGVSGSHVGTAVAQSHLRSLLVTVGMRVLGRPEMYIIAGEGFFDQAGFIALETDRHYLRRFLETFNDWLKVCEGK